MKLPITQFKKMNQFLQDTGIREGSWTLVKRKGRIRLTVEGRTGFFEFFRRKSVQIHDQSHQWVRSEHFEILTESGAAMVGEWDEVMRALKQWLSGPQSGG